MPNHLKTSYKKFYPFTLSCPSFIYPAGYVENVSALGAYVDEIELLLFESDPASLPSAEEMGQLKHLAAELNLTYNIHLPVDVSLAAEDEDQQDLAVSGILRAIDRSRPLLPTSYTLHLPCPAEHRDSSGHTRWLSRLENNSRRLLWQSGLPASAFAVETLDYPFFWLDDLIRQMGFSVCFDTGHLMVAGEDCRAFFRRYRDRIAILHIHGVAAGRDHLALDRLNRDQRRVIGEIISGFPKTISLEVFSESDLAASLNHLAQIWKSR